MRGVHRALCGRWSVEVSDLRAPKQEEGFRGADLRGPARREGGSHPAERHEEVLVDFLRFPGLVSQK
jgi:hypothetical protein